MSRTEPIGTEIECSSCGKTHTRWKKWVRSCKECVRSKRREKYYPDGIREKAKAYEKTKKGFLMRLYRNMQSRVTGVQKAKWHLYKGKELLPRQEFYDWAENNRDFHSLFTQWEQSDYDRRLTP